MLLVSQPAFQKRDHFHRFGLHTGSTRAAYPTSQGKQPFDTSCTDRTKKINKGDLVHNWLHLLFVYPPFQGVDFHLHIQRTNLHREFSQLFFLPSHIRTQCHSSICHISRSSSNSSFSWISITISRNALTIFAAISVLIGTSFN